MAAKAEVPDLSPTLRTALSSARMLQDPFAEMCHVIAPMGYVTQPLLLTTLTFHPWMFDPSIT